MERRQFVFNDWISSGSYFKGQGTDFALRVDFPDINTFPRLADLVDAVTELWKINRKDFYCPVLFYDNNIPKDATMTIK